VFSFFGAHKSQENEPVAASTSAPASAPAPVLESSIAAARPRQPPHSGEVEVEDECAEGSNAEAEHAPSPSTSSNTDEDMEDVHTTRPPARPATRTHTTNAHTRTHAGTRTTRGTVRRQPRQPSLDASRARAKSFFALMRRSSDAIHTARARKHAHAVVMQAEEFDPYVFIKNLPQLTPEQLNRPACVPKKTRCTGTARRQKSHGEGCVCVWGCVRACVCVCV
jgi:hypothetical protein